MIVFSGLAFAAGQGCLAVFARGIQLPLNISVLLRDSVTAWSFYAFVVLYMAGTYVMVRLVQDLPLVQVSVSIIGVTIIGSVLLTFGLGQALALKQLFGIAVVFAGICLLR